MKTYLTKYMLRDRYGYKSAISIDRAWKAGRLPPPTIYLSRHPLWDRDIIEAHEKTLVRTEADNARSKLWRDQNRKGNSVQQGVDQETNR